MEGFIVMGILRRVGAFSIFIATLSVGNVLANQSNDLLVAMEAGRCVPQAEKLHKMALMGDALSQLAFGQAASKNLCGDGERIFFLLVSQVRRTGKRYSASCAWEASCDFVGT